MQDKYTIVLLNGQKATLVIPLPINLEEKERIKAYIDLIFEEEIEIKSELEEDSDRNNPRKPIY